MKEDAECSIQGKIKPRVFTTGLEREKKLNTLVVSWEGIQIVKCQSVRIEKQMEKGQAGLAMRVRKQDLAAILLPPLCPEDGKIGEENFRCLGRLAQVSAKVAMARMYCFFVVPC